MKLKFNTSKLKEMILKNSTVFQSVCCDHSCTDWDRDQIAQRQKLSLTSRMWKCGNVNFSKNIRLILAYNPTLFKHSALVCLKEDNFLFCDQDNFPCFYNHCLSAIIIGIKPPLLATNLSSQNVVPLGSKTLMTHSGAVIIM